jgi:hypothetical protein
MGKNEKQEDKVQVDGIVVTKDSSRSRDVPTEMPKAQMRHSVSIASAQKGSYHKQSPGGKEWEEQTFNGMAIHPPKRDHADLDGNVVLVIGFGANGVEAVETALWHGAWHTVMISLHHTPWLRTRWRVSQVNFPWNIMLDTLVSAQPFWDQMPTTVGMFCIFASDSHSPRLIKKMPSFPWENSSFSSITVASKPSL